MRSGSMLAKDADFASEHLTCNKNYKITIHCIVTNKCVKF